MRVKEAKKRELLEVAKSVLPGVEWAPEEAWLTDGLSEEEARKPSEPLHFRDGELTLFLKADLGGQHYNSLSRLTHAVEKWVERELGTGVKVDVRFFRLGKEEKEEEEVGLSF